MSTLNELLQRQHELEDKLRECKKHIARTSRRLDECAGALCDFESYELLAKYCANDAMDGRALTRDIETQL
jgi:hypothetical protein